MKRICFWVFVLFLTAPVWAVLMLLEPPAFVVRNLSRLCVAVVRPPSTYLMLAVAAWRAERSRLPAEAVHGVAGAKFLAKARRARRR